MKHIMVEIRQRRKELGITQVRMGELLGMTQSQYQKIEANGNPSLKTLQSILLALDLKLMLIPKETFSELSHLIQAKDRPGPDINLFDKYEVKENEK